MVRFRSLPSWRLEAVLHRHSAGHFCFAVVDRDNGDRVVLEIAFDLDVFASKRRDGLRFPYERVDLVAGYKSVAAPALDALLNALRIGLSGHHVLLAAHRIAYDTIDGFGRCMNLLDCRNHSGRYKGEDKDWRLSHVFSDSMKFEQRCEALRF